MKNNLFSKILLAATILVAACSKSGQGDKAAQLEDLKKQQLEIMAKIQQLELEMKKSSDSAFLADASGKAKLVKVEALKPGTFAHYVEIQGKVETNNNVLVSSETAGIIKNITVKVGDKVKKGQVLAELDNVLVRKGIEELKTALELATTVFEKQEKLWKDNVGTEIQYLQAKNNKESLENKMDQLKEQLKKTRITASMDGVIDELFKKEGELQSPGVPVFRLVNFSDFKIVGELAESYISKINVGDEVEVYFPDLNKSIKEKISVVGSTINPTNRTFSMEIRLSNSQSSIKPNLVTYLKIKDFSKPNSIVVPINTLQRDRDNQYVYVAEAGKVVKKVVKVGETYGTTAQILEGLKQGDSLITFGYNDLTEGQTIKY